jgi:hypothetical protein
MKKILLSTLLSLHLSALGAPEESSRVLKDSTTWVALELNDKTVFCTDKGYGNVQLKVSVPDLDWLAHFDHRVVGERVPCITGGACSEFLQPDKLLDGGNSIVVVPMRVVLTEHLKIDRDAQSCERQIQEAVHSQIKGQMFSHYRSGAWQSANLDICENELGL